MFIPTEAGALNVLNADVESQAGIREIFAPSEGIVLSVSVKSHDVGRGCISSVPPETAFHALFIRG